MNKGVAVSLFLTLFTCLDAGQVCNGHNDPVSFCKTDYKNNNGEHNCTKTLNDDACCCDLGCNATSISGRGGECVVVNECETFCICYNNTDEASCRLNYLASEGRFQCRNGNFTCQDDWQVSDGHDGLLCGDNSDELASFCKTACKNHNCEHHCMKTPNGDACSCKSGFNATVGGKCGDVNECEIFGICSQDCRNARGKCRPGYHTEESTGNCAAYHGRRLLFFSTKKEVRAVVTEEDGDNSDELASFCKNHNCEHNGTRAPNGDVCYCHLGFNATSGHGSDAKCKTFGICRQDCRIQCKSKNEKYIFFSTTGKGVISLLVNEDGKYHQAFQANSSRRILAVQYDGQEANVYWTALKNKKENIAFSRLGSVETRYMFNHSSITPEGIAIDHIGRNIYFTDPNKNRVGVANMDTKLWTPLISEGLEKPQAIAVFPEKGLLFVSDSGNRSPRIIRADMDGGHVVTLVESGVKWINGLAVDKVTERIYWSDALGDPLTSVRLDGSDRLPLLIEEVSYPFSVAILEDTIYWSDLKHMEIRSCNKYTGKDLTTIFKDSQITPMIISVYPFESPTEKSPCLASPCSHLCLLTPRGGYSCRCPGNGTLQSDNHNCQKEEVEKTTTIPDHIPSSTQTPEENETSETLMTEEDRQEYSKGAIVGSVIGSVVVIVVVVILWGVYYFKGRRRSIGGTEYSYKGLSASAKD